MINSSPHQALEFMSMQQPALLNAGDETSGMAIPLSKVLACHAEISKIRFLSNGQEVDGEVFFGPEIFLPAVVWEAQSLGQKLLGADLGCRLRAEPHTLFGVRASVPLITGNLADIMRALFCIHAAKKCCGDARHTSIEMGLVIDAYKDKFSGLLEVATQDDGEIKWPHQTW